MGRPDPVEVGEFLRAVEIEPGIRPPSGGPVVAEILVEGLVFPEDKDHVTDAAAKKARDTAVLPGESLPLLPGETVVPKGPLGPAREFRREMLEGHLLEKAMHHVADVLPLAIRPDAEAFAGGDVENVVMDRERGGIPRRRNQAKPLAAMGVVDGDVVVAGVGDIETASGIRESIGITPGGRAPVGRVVDRADGAEGADVDLHEGVVVGVGDPNLGMSRNGDEGGGMDPGRGRARAEDGTGEDPSQHPKIGSVHHGDAVPSPIADHETPTAIREHHGERIRSHVDVARLPGSEIDARKTVGEKTRHVEVAAMRPHHDGIRVEEPGRFFVITLVGVRVLGPRERLPAKRVASDHLHPAPPEAESQDLIRGPAAGVPHPVGSRDQPLEEIGVRERTGGNGCRIFFGAKSLQRLFPAHAGRLVGGVDDARRAGATGIDRKTASARGGQGDPTRRGDSAERRQAGDTVQSGGVPRERLPGRGPVGEDHNATARDGNVGWEVGCTHDPAHGGDLASGGQDPDEEGAIARADPHRPWNDAGTRPFGPSHAHRDERQNQRKDKSRSRKARHRRGAGLGRHGSTPGDQRGMLIIGRNHENLQTALQGVTKGV